MDRALEEAGIDRKQVYVTNAVKHFKWKPRGKRRIHQKPNSREIAACRPWLEAELRLVRPKLLLCLGSTAGQAIFGPSFRVTRERGKLLSARLAPKVVATVHPSSLLRQPDEESRHRECANFIADLRVALTAAGEKSNCNAVYDRRRFLLKDSTDEKSKTFSKQPARHRFTCRSYSIIELRFGRCRRRGRWARGRFGFLSFLS
jgi:uracil-DNA glycosylase family 4